MDHVTLRIGSTTTHMMGIISARRQAAPAARPLGARAGEPPCAAGRRPLEGRAEIGDNAGMEPIAFVTEPAPLVWTAARRALAAADIVAIAADLRADTGSEDPRADLEALLADDSGGGPRGRVAGPASGGARAGEGRASGAKAALCTRLGPAFEAATRGLDLIEAVDLGLGWDLDEADLVLRWAARGDVAVIGLAAPRPAARLAVALRAVQGRIPVIVADAAQRAWYRLGAAVVPSLEALRLALTLPAFDGTSMALVGGSGPGLAALADALATAGITLLAPARAARPVIAQDVHARARLGADPARPVVDLLGTATARHVELAARVMAEDEYVTAVVCLGRAGEPATAPSEVEKPVLMCPADADPWAFASALRARLDASREVASPPLPAPAVDLERAHALLTAALLMKRQRLAREESLGVLAAMGLGKAAPTVQVASLAAATEAAQRLGWPVVLGAPGAVTELAPLPDAAALAERWDAVAAELAAARADTLAARWVAPIAADGEALGLVIAAGEVGPVAEWRAGNDGSSVALPARAADTGGPAAFLGAASGLIEAFADLERVELTAWNAAAGVSLLDATIVCRPEDGA
ncbi:MAG: hypothetical protein U1F43_13270 [Myxococcota bacterium]